jgi:DNA-binding CsgD family transcriptional regulator
MTTSRDSRAIVKSIIDLAAGIEMDCVAVGVETEETAGLLESLGVGALQGHLIAQPMPVEAIPVWFAGWAHRGPTVSQTLFAAGHATESAEPVRETGPVGAPARLSPRQADVMQLLTDGCSVKEIARRLGIGIGTVKVHVALSYTALNAHNRVEAVMRAGLRPGCQLIRPCQPQQSYP